MVFQMNASRVSARSPVLLLILRHGQDEGHDLSLAGHETCGLAVACVHDGKGLKGSGCLAHTRQNGPAVVHFKGLAQRDRLVRPQPLVSPFVHNHRIGTADVFQGSRHELLRSAHQRPVVQTDENHLLEAAVQVRFLGDPAGELVQKFLLPPQPDPGFGLFAADAGGVAPSPNPFRLFDQGNAFEKEPNDSLPEATPAEMPLALCGIIQTAGDADCFKFAAKNGQVFDVECYTRRIASALDPVLNLYSADGTSIAGNDDSCGLDSYFRFTAPADAEYVVRIADHLGRGGPDFVYRIEFQPVRPSLTLGIPRVERYGQYRQTVSVPRGNRLGTLISAARSNFGGDLILEGNDLPPGVTMHTDPMPSNLSVIPVVFEAAADAPIGGKLVDFTARHADPSQNIRGGFVNRADFIVGPPGQSLYRWKDVNRLAVAVVEPLPFQLEIVEPKVPLVRDGSMQLRILAHRQEEFTAPITVELPFQPPGVGAATSVTIAEGQTEALYPVNAGSNAQLGKWKVFALGSANVNGIVWASSQLANLEVAVPYVAFDMQRTACEQGQETKIYCKLNHNTPFEGSATAQLLGLPTKASAEDLTFTNDNTTRACRGLAPGRRGQRRGGSTAGAARVD
jgi:hypothetical protein